MRSALCFYLIVLDPDLSFRMVLNDDIDDIIQRGEERTAELNSKYEGLNLEDLNNFKSDASVQQWEGEDFRPVCHSYFILHYFDYCLRKNPSTSICCRYQNERENRTIPWITISRTLFALVLPKLKKRPRYPGRQSKLLCNRLDLIECNIHLTYWQPGFPILSSWAGRVARTGDGGS